MSTDTKIIAKPLGLVLPNFARNKLAAAATATVITTNITGHAVVNTIIPTRSPIPIVMPRAPTNSSLLQLAQPIIIARPNILPIQNHVVLVIPKPQSITPTTSIILVTHTATLINSPKIPKVIKPCSPQLIAPRLSPGRPLINSHALRAASTPGITIPRLRTPGRIAINNSSDISNISDNPWLPTKSDSDPLMIKVTAMTPIGTIALVPTTDKRPPHTPRRQPPTPRHNVNLKIIEEQDPLMNATIYLDVGHNDKRGYNYVSDHMRSIATTTSDLQKQYATQYRLLPKIQGHVTLVQFEDLLNIYENNQVFYQDRLDDKQISLANVEYGLTQLEHWFMRIIEPVPTNDFESWKQREQTKILKGYSAYCDPELYKHIVPASNILRNEIQVL